MKHSLSHCLITVLLVCAVAMGCGHSDQKTSDSQTGHISFSPTIQDSSKSMAHGSKAVDCGALGVQTVRATVYTSGGSTAATGGPWACSSHAGTVSNVPPGSQYRIVVQAVDGNSVVRYSGTVSGLAVTAGGNSHAGEIYLSPVDTDNDGVIDGVDQCPGTPAESIVDDTGCLVTDTDGDGVTDFLDQCPGTPAGMTVDGMGCHDTLIWDLDTDSDGVMDGFDQCPDTPAGSIVDVIGCVMDVDGDGDGVSDGVDQCPNTPAGFLVDSVGCVIPIPPPVANSLGMGFVYIVPGTFMMGSSTNEPERVSDEIQHTVILSKGYYMQTTEVTQGQWKAVMGSNPSNFSSCGDDCPVEYVSWNDSQAFITALNTLEGTDVVYRLPTEAEWEYSARAGTQTPFAFGYCLGTDQANYDGNHPLTGSSSGIFRNTPVAVASFFPNDWALYDMHGNVREWCQDWYGDYSSGSVTDPSGPSTGSNRVLRGGSWNYSAKYCRSAFRYGYNPGFRGNYVGFRLAYSPGQ